MKTLTFALLVFVFVISPSIGLALNDPINDNQKRVITIYPQDEQPSISSSEEESLYELFTDAYVTAELSVKQAEDELDPIIVRSRYVRINLEYLKEIESIVLNLFDDVSISAVRDRVEERSESRYTWFGHVSGRGYSSVILTIENGDMAGQISIGGWTYHVRPVGNEIHVVSELDLSAIPPAPPCESPPHQYPDKSSISAEQYTAAPQLQNDDGSTIDVMVVYTDDAARAVANIEAEIQLAVDVTNKSYEDSFIFQRIRLVHTAEIDYQESGYVEQDHYNCQETYRNLCLNQIDYWRDIYRADLVSFWVEGECHSAGCIDGRTTTLTDLTAPPDGRPYLSTVARRYAIDNYTFAHELGHNMGAGHDEDAGGSGAFTFSQGYVWRKTILFITYAFKSIMAYDDWCIANNVLLCPKIGLWSTPRITIDGLPFGDLDTADNRKTLNLTAFTVANNRQSNLPPVCDANGPYVAECGGATTEIMLDGTGSSDPDGDPLIYEWSSSCPGESFDDSTIDQPRLTVDTSSGGTVVCDTFLSVTDSKGLSDSCSSTVNVQDTTPPSITCPLDTVIECDESTDPTNTGSASATDVCDPGTIVTFSDTVAPRTCSQESLITRSWTATDTSGNSSSCVQTIEVVDTTPSDIQCNAPETIIPPDAPISFTATATDNCAGDPSVEIIGYDCFKFTKKGKRIDKTEACIVEVNWDTITVEDSGGVNDNITWTVRANDNCGNITEPTCSVMVVKPGKP